MLQANECLYLHLRKDAGRIRMLPQPPVPAPFARAMRGGGRSPAPLLLVLPDVPEKLIKLLLFMMLLLQPREIPYRRPSDAAREAAAATLQTPQLLNATALT